MLSRKGRLRVPTWGATSCQPSVFSLVPSAAASAAFLRVGLLILDTLIFCFFIETPYRKLLIYGSLNQWLASLTFTHRLYRSE